ncbi:MAG: hypothetical protein LBC61_05315 [Candidatus Peribacteria bacterium]|jgi:hypothetical protein|nr:hypothetical protein [Candidatus Peribacteria bacterium]
MNKTRLHQKNDDITSIYTIIKQYEPAFLPQSRIIESNLTKYSDYIINLTKEFLGSKGPFP